MKKKFFSEQVAIVTGGASGIVANMAHTMMHALSPDRNVVLEDISIFSR